MTDYFLDSSALVKRYATEPGSAWVQRVTESVADSSILLAEITLAEVSAALAAKHRSPNGISEDDLIKVSSRFLQDCDEYFLLIPTDRFVIDIAVELPRKYRLRGYDSVQLATAVVVRETLKSQDINAPVFIACDDDLLNAALDEDFHIENPLDYA